MRNNRTSWTQKCINEHVILIGESSIIKAPFRHLSIIFDPRDILNRCHLVKVFDSIWTKFVSFRPDSPGSCLVSSTDRIDQISTEYGVKWRKSS
jgi:hypothetical protein